MALALPALSLAGCPDGGDEPAVGAGVRAEVESDAEVLEVARVLNQSIMEAVLAVRPRLTDADVELLADDVLAEHRGARERSMVLAERLDLTLTPTPESLQLERDAAARLDHDVTRRGAVLERDWLGDLVAQHDDALGLVDRQLLPAAQRPEVRELLQDMRRLMSAHATRAEDLGAR